MVLRGERVSNDPDLLDNLQAWIDYDYDTRLLHSALAFPLLRKLANSGEIKAKKMLKEEILNRFLSGNYITVWTLLSGLYLDYFTEEERKDLLLKENHKLRAKILQNLEKKGCLEKEEFYILELLIKKYNDLEAKNILKLILKKGDFIYQYKDSKCTYRSEFEFLLHERIFNVLSPEELLDSILESNSPRTKKILNVLQHLGHSKQELKNLIKQVAKKEGILILNEIIYLCSLLHNYSDLELKECIIDLIKN